jgi:hypothetical protein
VGYFDQYGFFARTKYRLAGERMAISCDACKRYVRDVEESYDESYVRCACVCENSDDSDREVTYARVRDEGCLSDEVKNTRWRKRYVSTGVMLIVDSRARPTPAYKNFGLATGESWRRKRPARRRV